MRVRLLALLLCLAALCVLACSTWLAGLGQQGDPARDAWVLPDEMGGIYRKQCKVCHGAELGGSSLGPSLLAENLQHGDSVDELVASNANGNPAARMPAWAEALPAGDIRGLAIYIAEQRVGETGNASNGVGPPPVIPIAPIETQLYSLVLRPLIGGLSEPYSIAPLPDGRILVTEKMRGLSIVSADGSAATLVSGTPRFYDDAVLRGTTYAGNGWAHEVALHPDFAANGWIYLSYGDRCQGCNELSKRTGRPVTMLKLIRGRLEGSVWTDQETIWEAPKDSYLDGLENGAAARIAFDDEGFVYLAVGVLSDYRGIQDLGKPYGKIHRMHDDGRTPTDNPFVDEPGALASVYTLGHRNPHHISFAQGRMG